MPSGTLSWSLDRHTYLAGASEKGCYTLNYNIPNGIKNGVHY